jgi:hypothetical protein
LGFSRSSSASVSAALQARHVRATS